MSIDAQLTRSFRDALLAGHMVAVAADPIRRLRGEALERANALAVPSVQDEDWRFTDLTPLYRARLSVPPVRAAVNAARIGEWLLPEATAQLVFVDGTLLTECSRVASGDGATVQPISAVRGSEVEPWLGRVAAFDRDVFTAVNTAALKDGAWVHAPRDGTGVVVHCLFVNATPEAVCHPRLLVRAESGSDVTVIEDYVTLHDGSGCVNAVTEVSVAANARVRHVRIQRDSPAAFHIGTTAAAVDRDGVYGSHAFALGGRISRHALSIAQRGPGTHFDIDGLAWIRGRQLADTHSFVDHAAAHGTSRQLHKCVVDGGAHAVFNGRILVRQGSQQTDSAQESRTLLLSDRAHVDTKPQLEIFADDVKCAHGATVGQLEAEEVFYLRSRGLSENTARKVLTFGFAADVVNRIPVPSLVRRLRTLILEQSGGQEIA